MAVSELFDRSPKRVSSVLSAIHHCVEENDALKALRCTAIRESFVFAEGFGTKFITQ